MEVNFRLRDIDYITSQTESWKISLYTNFSILYYLIYLLRTKTVQRMLKTLSSWRMVLNLSLKSLDVSGMGFHLGVQSSF